MCNGTVNMTGRGYNRAGKNGGAIYLKHSVLFASQGSLIFHNNSADNGGAIYIGEGSKLNATLNGTSLEFLDNGATYNVGAVYVDLNYINDATVNHQLAMYYYNLLTGANCTCDLSNTADIGNCAYFDAQFSNVHSSIADHHFKPFALSLLPCFDDCMTYSNSTVQVI